MSVSGLGTIHSDPNGRLVVASPIHQARRTYFPCRAQSRLGIRPMRMVLVKRFVWFDQA